MDVNVPFMNINYTLYIAFLFITVSFDTYTSYISSIELSDMALFDEE